MGKEQKVKGLRLPAILLLCLAPLLLIAGAKTGRDQLRSIRAGRCTLTLPPAHEFRLTPVVVVLGGDNALTLELGRRGYAVASVGSRSQTDAEDAFAFLLAQEQLDTHDLAFVAIGKAEAETALNCIRTLSPEEYTVQALILVGCEAEEAGDVRNVLSLYREEKELDGYFAEGSARGHKKQGSPRDNMTEIISWLGSTLGHPRDGFFADDEFICFRARALQLAGILSAVAAIVLSLCDRKKKALT